MRRIWNWLRSALPHRHRARETRCEGGRHVPLITLRTRAGDQEIPDLEVYVCRVCGALFAGEPHQHTLEDALRRDVWLRQMEAGANPGGAPR